MLPSKLTVLDGSFQFFNHIWGLWAGGDKISFCCKQHGFLFRLNQVLSQPISDISYPMIA